MSKKIITIKDIAETLHISTATVSRALRGSTDIKKETRLEVMRVAKELDYHPNLLASSLSSKKSKVLGVIVPTINRQFWSNSISGIEKCAYEHGYKVMIFQSSESYQKELEIIETLANSRVDGILMALSQETSSYDHIQSTIDRGIPILLFERVCSEIHTSKIVTDDFNGAREVVEHLISRGKRQIAYLSGPMSLGVCEERMKGFLQALKNHGITPDPKLIVETQEFSFETAENAMYHLWQQSTKPDALFCFADIFAIGAIHACKKMNVSVPEDIAIVGFGNDDVGRFISPALTTMSQASFEMGTIAAELIFQEINNEEDTFNHIHKVIKPELLVRGSS